MAARSQSLAGKVTRRKSDRTIIGVHRPRSIASAPEIRGTKTGTIDVTYFIGGVKAALDSKSSACVNCHEASVTFFICSSGKCRSESEPRFRRSPFISEGFAHYRIYV
ncbi:hypothetical protein ACJJTC_007584 [Scirpophaga incertulas]